MWEENGNKVGKIRFLAMFLQFFTKRHSETPDTAMDDKLNAHVN